MLFKIKSTQCILWAVHCLCRMSRRVLLVVLWLLIGTRSRLLLRRTSQYHRSFVPLSASLWNDLSDPVFEGVWLTGFKSRANALLLAWSAFLFCLLLFYLLFPSMGWLCGVGVFGLIECSHSLPALHSWLQMIIIIISIRITPTKLLKHFISRTFTFLLSALLIPHASAPYNAVGSITPSYRHFLSFIPNPLLLSTLFIIHSVYHIPVPSSINQSQVPGTFQVPKTMHFLYQFAV